VLAGVVVATLVLAVTVAVITALGA